MIIVLGVDGSEESHLATEWTAAVASRLGASVVAVHAAGLLEHERGDPSGSHLAGRLREWTRPLDALADGAARRRVVNGEPVSTLLRAVADEGADLLVVGTRGAGSRPPGMLGSTSLELASHATCPVVVVPPAPLPRAPDPDGS